MILRKYEPQWRLREDTIDTPGKQIAAQIESLGWVRPPHFLRRRTAELHASRVHTGLCYDELNRPIEKSVWVHLYPVVVDRTKEP